jgi:DNA-binding response OmpR family regulator
MSKILIIEDDPAIVRGLKDTLEDESFEVLSATDGKEGYSKVIQDKPDLIILDLMLPKLDGFDLCRRVRNERIPTPILILTARGEEADRVRGLDLGADDYVIKPFSLLELLARVRALLRRPPPTSSATKPLGKILEFGDISVDFRCFEARKKGKILEMSRKEFGILRCLASRSGGVVTRDELLDEVWSIDSYPTTRTVDNHMSMIRAKIEDNPSEPKYLVTVHGVGYKLIVEEKLEV